MLSVCTSTAGPRHMDRQQLKGQPSIHGILNLPQDLLADEHGYPAAHGLMVNGYAPAHHTSRIESNLGRGQAHRSIGAASESTQIMDLP